MTDSYLQSSLYTYIIYVHIYMYITYIIYVHIYMYIYMNFDYLFHL